MVLTERDPNVSGRSSRASEYSIASKPPKPLQAASTSVKQPDALAASIMSMSRTTTDVGDIASLTLRAPRVGKDQRPISRPTSVAASRISTGSGQSYASRGRPHHPSWVSASSLERRHAVTETLIPDDSHRVVPARSIVSTHENDARTRSTALPTGRSMSLTTASSLPHSLNKYQSLTSLRSYHAPQRPRSPYRYPTRLRRPSYRPPSPAYSDITGGFTGKGHSMQASRLGYVQKLPKPAELKVEQPYLGQWNRSAPAVARIQAQEESMRVNPLQRRPSPAITITDRTVSTRTTGSLATNTNITGRGSGEVYGPVDPNSQRKAVVPRRALVDPTTLKPSNAARSSTNVTEDVSVGCSQLDKEEWAKRISEVYEESTTMPIPAGFVERIRALLEDKANHDLAQHAHLVETARSSLLDVPSSPDLPELPATPIAGPTKRITREMILAAISTDSESTQNLMSARLTSLHNKNLDHFAKACTSDVRIDFPIRQSLTSEAQTSESQETATGEMLHRALRYNTVDSVQTELEYVDTDDDANIVQVIHGESNADQDENDTVISNTTVPIAMPTPMKKLSVATLETGLRKTPSQPLDPISDPPRPASYPQEPRPASRAKWPSDHDTSYTTEPRIDIASVVSLTPASACDVLSMGAENVSPAHCTHVVVHPIRNIAEITTAGLLSPPISPLSTRQCMSEDLNDARSSVSPLTLHKTPDPAIPPQSKARQSTHLLTTGWEFGRARSVSTPTPRSPSATELLKVPSNDDTTTALRFSAFSPLERALPDVKEEPSLEGSTGEFRLSNFRFPLPNSFNRCLSLDHARRSLDGRRDSIRPPVITDSSQPLRDTRVIPSFNFSQVDLFAKLNEAMEQRHRSSFDAFSRFLEASPRTSPSGLIAREKYHSLFSSLDDSEHHYGNLTEHIGEDQEVNLAVDEAELNTADAEKPPRPPTSNPTLRPLSRDELLDEVNAISIPSMNGLTQRLSEFLPVLKKYYAGEDIVEKDPVESTLEQVRNLGRSISPAPGEDINNRASDGKGSHESDDINIRRPVEKLSASSGHMTIPDSKRSAELASSTYRVQTSPAELEAPMPAHIRQRSLSETDVDKAMGMRNTKDQKRTLRHSFTGGSPSDPPQWQIDGKCPWQELNPPVDISLPVSILRRDNPKSGSSRLRLRSSGSASVRKEGGVVQRPSSKSSLPDDPTTSTQDTFGQTNNKRRVSRPSVSGSVTRNRGAVTSLRSSTFGSNGHRAEDRAVDPGDRYPITSLSPPSAFNLSEVRSFFSDDSSQDGGEARNSKNVASLKKRLTQLKSGFRPGTRAQSAFDHHGTLRSDRSNSLFGNGSNANIGLPNAGIVQLAEPRSCNGSHAGRVYPDGTCGMSRTEFVRKRLMERVKSLWYRGGQLIRSMSARNHSHNDASGMEAIVGSGDDRGRGRDRDMDRWSEQGVSVDYASLHTSLDGRDSPVSMLRRDSVVQTVDSTTAAPSEAVPSGSKD